MKKTIIIAAAAVLLSSGVRSSQVKVNNAPTIQAISIQKVVSTDKKDLGSAD
jgi:hypothetical protein